MGRSAAIHRRRRSWDLWLISNVSQQGEEVLEGAYDIGRGELRAGAL
jgi:hypothetical protein